MYILVRTSFKNVDPAYIRHFQYLFFFLAPSKAPENVTIHSFMGHDTMRITWSHIKSQYVHGDLQGYKITFKLLKIGGQSIVTAKHSMKIIHPSKVETALTGLEANSEYAIAILAYNEYGNGITSSAMVGGRLNTQIVKHSDYDHCSFRYFMAPFDNLAHHYSFCACIVNIFSHNLYVDELTLFSNWQ